MRRRLAILIAASALVVLACSPEATRQREGGLGADPGNHARAIDLHAPYGPTPTPIPAALRPGGR